jgi:hypothetical protein
MWAESLFGNEATRLAKDGPAGSSIELEVCGNRQCLGGAIRKLSPKLHMASALGMDHEAEPPKN